MIHTPINIGAMIAATTAASSVARQNMIRQNKEKAKADSTFQYELLYGKSTDTSITKHTKEILPCPFCKAKVKLKHGRYNELGTYGTPEQNHTWFAVYCPNCLVSQPKRKYENRDDAINAWNERHIVER